MNYVNIIIDKIYDYYKNNNDVLNTSIDIEITNVKNNLVTCEYKISKIRDTINLLTKNSKEQELIYNKSKDDLNNFNVKLHESILKYKQNIIHLLDNENLKENLKTTCNTLKSLYNDFEMLDDITIFEKYEKLNSIIEENVIKCEIAKEKLIPFTKNLKNLENEKNINDIKLNKLIELKKSCEITEL